MRIVWILAIAVAAGVAAGCGGSDPAGLHETARSVLPPSVRLAGQEDGDCDEFAPFPNCVLVLFDFKGNPDVEDRMAIVRVTVEEKGWRFDRLSAGPGGIGLFFERNGYRANFSLWEDPRPSCGIIPSIRTCASVVDHVQVIRD